jgi:hypothetical protein
MRKLAYEFGQKLLPRKDKFESLYYALDLNTPCDGEAPMEMKSNPAFVNPQPADLAADAIYVSPNGDDSAKGTEAAPLKTIQKAIDAAAAVKSTSVVLRKGTFFLTGALNVGTQHNGIAITAFPNESPVVSGGKMLKTAWTAYNVTKPGNTTFVVQQNDNIVDKSKVDNKTVIDFGTTANAADCEAACLKDEACTGFTWHDTNQGKKYALLCRFRLDGQHTEYTQSGHTSGWKTADPGLNIYVTDLTGQVSAAVGVPGLQLVDPATGAVSRATRARYPNLPGGIETSCGYGCMLDEHSAKWTPPDMNKYGPVDYYTDNISAHDRNDTTINGKTGTTWFQHYMIGRKGLCTVHTHTVLIPYSYPTHTVLIPYSYRTHTVLIPYSYPTHTVLIPHSYRTHTPLIPHSYPPPQVYDPPVSYWCSEHTAGGGAFAFRTPSGLTPTSRSVLPNSPYKVMATAPPMFIHSVLIHCALSIGSQRGNPKRVAPVALGQLDV